MFKHIEKTYNMLIPANSQSQRFPHQPKRTHLPACLELIWQDASGEKPLNRTGGRKMQTNTWVTHDTIDERILEEDMASEGQKIHEAYGVDERASGSQPTSTAGAFAEVLPLREPRISTRQIVEEVDPRLAAEQLASYPTSLCIPSYAEIEAKQWSVHDLLKWGRYESYREQVSTLDRILQDEGLPVDTREICELHSCGLDDATLGATGTLGGTGPLSYTYIGIPDEESTICHILPLRGLLHLRGEQAAAVDHATLTIRMHTKERAYSFTTQNVRGFGATEAAHRAWLQSLDRNTPYGAQDVALIQETHVAIHEIDEMQCEYAARWEYRVEMVLLGWGAAEDRTGGVGILINPYGKFTGAKPLW
ncbi:hypothetical protein ON010_g15172 [Phytophthora cinnamomi]|nr:hypothetical protein ON010_g15172 [Phytophthora cinnamomi]